jgi:hypothetical protein
MAILNNQVPASLYHSSSIRPPRRLPELGDRGILPRHLPAMQISGMQKCNLAAVDSGPFQAKEIASEAS